MVNTPSKACVTCGNTKALDEFHKHNAHADGRASSCKECAKARTKKWQNDNRERRNEGNRERYQRNLEKSREAGRQGQARRRARLKANPTSPFINDPCAYCGAPSETWDHVRPVSKGGADHPDNKVRACLRCNQEKSDTDLLQFMLDRALRWDAEQVSKAA